MAAITFGIDRVIFLELAYNFHIHSASARRGPSSNSERSDLRFEARKPAFVKSDMGVYMIDL
jgi:hypothetical protein